MMDFHAAAWFALVTLGLLFLYCLTRRLVVQDARRAPGPGKYPEDHSSDPSTQMLPEKSTEAGQGIPVERYIMELRSECSGIHESLMHKKIQ